MGNYIPIMIRSNHRRMFCNFACSALQRVGRPAVPPLKQGGSHGRVFAKTAFGSFLARTYVSAFPSIDRSIPFPSFDPSQRKKKKKGLTIRDIVFDFEHSILCIMLHVSGIFCMFFASSCIFVWSIFVAL